MKKYTFTSLAVGPVFGLAAATTVVADSTDDVIAELRSQVAELRSEVSQLRATSSNSDQWLDEQRAAEVRAIVHDVLADAETRTSLLQSGMSAGHDGRFFMASADGNYRLNVSGRAQIRYMYNRQDNSPSGDDNRAGFENRRTRLAVSGHVVDPSWGFQLQGDFGRSGGGFTLLDAYIDKKFDNGLTLRFGQFRPRFLYEDSNSSARLLTVERSLVNAFFAQGRTQGLELRGSAGDQVNWSVAFTDGIPSTTGLQGSGANVPWQTAQTEFSILGRVDFLAAGTNWRQFRDFSSWSDEDFGLLLGAAGLWQKDEYGQVGAKTEVFRWTIDANAKFGGISLFAALIGNHEDDDAAVSVDQYGFVFQGGVFVVPDEWEVFARYEWADADATGVDDLSVITFGVTRYFAKHNIKWVTDVGIGLNEVDATFASSSAGYRADAAGEDGQLVFRTLFQLAF